jgi:iron complex outermembrane receptor protein
MYEPENYYKLGVKYSFKLNEYITFRSNFQYDELLTKDQTYEYFSFDQNYNLYKWMTNYFDKYTSITYSGYMYIDFTFSTYLLNNKLTIGKNRSKRIDKNYNYITTGQQDLYNIIIGDDIKIGEKWETLIGFNRASIISKGYNDTKRDTENDYHKNRVNPTFSLIYKPIDKLSVYATYIEGFESGGKVNDQKYSNYGEFFDPYVSKEYEFGVKYELNNLLLTLSLFNIEKANQFEDDSNGVLTLKQEGKQIHQGLELSATGKVGSDLSIYGGLTLLDAKVKKTNNPWEEGKRPGGVPKTIFKLYAEYSLPFLEGATVSAGIQYSGSTYQNIQRNLMYPSVTTFDLGARFKTEIKEIPTTFSIHANNITNKYYWSPGGGLGAPLTISFYVKFDIK